MKKYIKKIPVIGTVLSYVYRKVNNFRSTDEFQKYWINKFLENEEIQIIQIGSNDGKAADPLYDLVLKNDLWRVLYVEPVPYLFNKLKNNFPDSPRFTFENIAINDGSKQTFYYVNENASESINDLPHWYNQIGSFDKSHIVKHLDGILEPHIKELSIDGVTLNQLFVKNNIDDFELLHIDTEGYDWRILSQLDLESFKPKVILFEHKHLEKKEIKEAIEFLEMIYWIFELERDFLCIIKNIVSEADLNQLTKYIINTK